MKEFNYKLPKKTNKKRRILISLTVCVLSVLIAVSYALFIVIGKDRFINTEVAPFVVSAPAPCFNFNGVTGEIVGYYANEDNDPSKPACPMNVKVPDSINGQIVKKLGNYLFNGLGFTAVEIPNTVTSIGDYALANNNIRDLVIPDSVTSIGSYSFINSGIENLTLSTGLTIIPRSAFQDNKIISLEIPTNIKIIDTYAFRSNKIQVVLFHEGLEEIKGQGAFLNNEITHIDLPTSLKNVGKQTFNINKLPDEEAFIYKRNADGSIDNTTIVSYGGVKNENVVIPSQVKIIDDNSFDNANIKSVILNNGLEEIKSYAFFNNYLTSISIPSTVTSIGKLSFNKNRLNSSDAIIYGRNIDGTPNTTVVSYGGVGGVVSIPEGTTKVGNNSFMSSNISSLSLPSTLTGIGFGAFNDNKLTDDQAFIYNRNSDGSIDYSKIVSYGGINKNNINIPAMVNGIQLTIIGNTSFYNNGLTGTIDIPQTVTIIETYAFNNNKLTTITIPDSVITINTSSFTENMINSLILGNNVQNVEEYAFSNNNISAITIPSSVMKLGNNVFDLNPLTEVKIKGKSSPSDFTTYGTNIFTWRAGYSDVNIEWNAS